MPPRTSGKNLGRVSPSPCGGSRRKKSAAALVLLAILLSLAAVNLRSRPGRPRPSARRRPRDRRDLGGFPAPPGGDRFADGVLNHAIGTPEYDAVRFYVLSFPWEEACTKDDDDKTCRTDRSHYRAALADHPSRTRDMGEAAVVLSDRAFAFWGGLIQYCGCSYVDDATGAVVANTTQSMVDAQVRHYHGLKGAGRVREDSWLLLEGDELDVDLDHTDVALSGKGLVAGGRWPGVRGFNDVAIYHDDVNGPQPRPNCSAYADGPLVFFKGRNHGSWLREDFFGPRVADDGDDAAAVPPSRLEARFRNLRARMSALESQEARDLGVHFYSRTRTGEYSEAGKAVDYAENMASARFCPAPAGNGPWSFRTIEALEWGCIPVYVSGGSHLPYSPAVLWKNLAVRMEETFDFANVTLFRSELQRRMPTYFRAPDGDEHVCEVHRAIHRAWDYVTKNRAELWLASVKLRWMQRHGLLREGADYNDDAAFF